MHIITWKRKGGMVNGIEDTAVSADDDDDNLCQVHGITNFYLHYFFIQGKLNVWTFMFVVSLILD